MSQKTKIAWTEQTWNPVSGCTKISEGCKNCYAEAMAYRLQAMGTKGYEMAFEVTLHPEKLNEPLNRIKPTMYFVCSMGDLFHEDVPFEFIDSVFVNMVLCQQHTFQVLTKRPDRMAKYLKIADERLEVYFVDEDGEPISFQYPLPNLWLGVTAENQEQADKRIPILLDTPAVVRFVSVEPMIGAVDLTKIDCKEQYKNKEAIDRWIEVNSLTGRYYLKDRDDLAGRGNGLDWVICGGESGRNARPMHPDWARSLRNQCVEANIPYNKTTSLFEIRYI